MTRISITEIIRETRSPPPITNAQEFPCSSGTTCGIICIECRRMSYAPAAQDLTGKEQYNMTRIKIAETTREERERIVAESLGKIDAACDGCAAGLAEMYQEYIDGHKELREINMEFNARYTSSMTGPERIGCDWASM